MARNSVKSDDPHGQSRRSFLQAAASTALGLGSLSATAVAQQQTPASKPARPLASQPAWLTDGRERSRVVEAIQPRIVRGAVADSLALRDIVGEVVQRLADEASPERAWKRILDGCKTIVLKFNSVGSNLLTTNDALARVLVRGLATAGFPPEQVALIETSENLAAELETRKPTAGWGKQITVGGSPVALANYVLEADAVINVGLLKTHNIAGMSASMKNLAYGVIRHPARYHGGGCSPYVAEILADPELLKRMKINFVNGLQAVIDGGPEASNENVASIGVILGGTDPVALDAMAQSVLEGARRDAGLSASVSVAYMKAATQMGLGRARFQEIERITIR
ncbi:MAG: DUF362 domain-containing protein [Planctomycetes bacterium]|nr:DUF362 domain-containing protein [Planctomycetota bacterium]